jgi:hypothetical protein
LHYIAHRLHRGYYPLNLLGASPCEVPAQHVRAAKFPRAPWERALAPLLAPHPLCLVAGACTLLHQVVCNYYLLVDVMEALEV